MTYSTIDQDTREEIVERIVDSMLTIENLAHFVNQEFVMKELLRVRHQLIQLINDLGGHPAAR